MDYRRKYIEAYQQGRLRFYPDPKLTPQDYEITVYALAARTMTPRIPRPGDVVWVRPFEQATWLWAESRWTRHDVDAVGMKNGVEVECTLDDGTILTRACYLTTWRFDADHGPKEVLS